MKVNGRYSATELHQVLEVDWLDTYRKRYTCYEVYKLINGLGPPALVNLFEQHVPSRILRSNDAIILNRIKTKTIFAENDFVCRGMKYWSAIPSDVQHAPSLDAFKSNLKKCPNLFEHIT